MKIRNQEGNKCGLYHTGIWTEIRFYFYFLLEDDDAAPLVSGGEQLSRVVKLDRWYNVRWGREVTHKMDENLQVLNAGMKAANKQTCRNEISTGSGLCCPPEQKHNERPDCGVGGFVLAGLPEAQNRFCVFSSQDTLPCYILKLLYILFQICVTEKK